MFYIENRDALRVITMALNFASKPSSWIKNELTLLATDYFNYRRHRKYYHERMQSWDCGRQDQWCDKFANDLDRMKALRLARKIQRGHANSLLKQFNLVIGEY